MTEIIGAVFRLHSCFPFVTGPRATEADREFSHLVLRLKDGDRRAAQQCARILADHPVVGLFGGVLTPAPRSGRAAPRSNILLCDALLREGVGHDSVQFVGRAFDMPSAAQLRRRGGGEIRTERHAESMQIVEDPPFDEPIMIVDDVFTTGSTLRAVAAVLQRAGVPQRNLSAATVAYRSYAAGSDYSDNQYVTLAL